MVRAVTLDEQMQNTVVTLVSAGMSQRQAAMHVGCDQSTISKLAARSDKFAERLRGARMQSEASPLELVKRHADRSWRAAAWLLEKCHPHLYGKQASQASLRALEDERQRILDIIQQEIDDPQLRERFVARLHEQDEDEPRSEIQAEPQTKPEVKPPDSVQAKGVATPPETEPTPASPPPISHGGSAAEARPMAAVPASGSCSAASKAAPVRCYRKPNVLSLDSLKQLYPISCASAARPALPHLLPRPHQLKLSHCLLGSSKVRSDQATRKAGRGR